MRTKGQMSEGRDRSQMSDVRCQKSKSKGQRSDISSGGVRTGKDRSRKSEVGSQGMRN